jgi:acetate kinase
MILVINCGSQSIKWKIFDDRLGLVKQDNGIDLEKELGKTAEFREKIKLVGHRVVHGGADFKDITKITPEVLQKLEKINHLAPLHNPYNILGIKITQEVFGKASHFAVFDTEFFKDLEEKAFTYALPEDLAKKFGFRKYGFHGISHEFVAKEGAKKIKKDFNKLKIITCHLGGGASITAIKNGKVIDTSMGFTPLEGLVMMTRSGSIDPGIILELVKNFGPEKSGDILNKESGLKGISGKEKMLDVLSAMGRGDEKSKLAFDVFVYSIQKYIGSYFAILGGCDLLVFTGAIGAGLEITRKTICKDLNILKKTKISAMETDEELAIAQKIIAIF